MVSIILFLICPSWKHKYFLFATQILLEEKVRSDLKTWLRLYAFFCVLKYTFYLYRSSLKDPGKFQRECQYYISLSAAQQEKNVNLTLVVYVQHTGFIFCCCLGACSFANMKNIKYSLISHLFQDFQVIVLWKYYLLILWQYFCQGPWIQVQIYIRLF